MVASPKTENYSPLSEVPTKRVLLAGTSLDQLDLISQRRLSVAIFSDSLLPLANGVSVSIDTLVDELRRRGHEVDLYGPKFPGHQDPFESRTTRFQSISLPWADGYPVALPPAFPYLKAFRTRSYDIVHTHTIGIAAYIGLRWARAHEIPLVASYHTLYDRYAHYCRAVPRRYVRYKIARHTQLFYNQAAAIATPSETAKRWLLRHQVTKPISVIPTGIPRCQPCHRPEARAELGISPETKVLLTVGRIVEEKNLVTLVTAAAITMKTLGPSVQLWLVGDGPFREDVQKLARALGVEHQVKFVGPVLPTDVGRYYSAADLFVFASVTETQGLVVQEAMSYGLPAVLIEGGGSSGAVVHGCTGYLSKNNPDCLARVMMDALADPGQLNQLGINAQRAIRELSPEKMADSMLRLYESVLTPSQRRICALTSV